MTQESVEQRKCENCGEFGKCCMEAESQEPVAWDSNDKNFDAWWDSEYDDSTNPYRINTPAYWAWAGWKASQPQRTWVGLTDEERDNIRRFTLDVHGRLEFFAIAIEAKLKEKNNG